MHNTIPWKHLHLWFKHPKERVQKHRECSFHPASFNYLWDLWREAYYRQKGVDLFAMVQHRSTVAAGGFDPVKKIERVPKRPTGGDPSPNPRGDPKPCGFFNRPRGCRKNPCPWPHVCNVKLPSGRICGKNHARMICPDLRPAPRAAAGAEGGDNP